MDCLTRCIEYRNMLNEVKISGEEHLKVILQDPSAYLKKAMEARVKISSDPFLPSEYKENLLKEANGYIEKVEQGSQLKGGKLNVDILSLLSHLAAVGIGYHLGYSKKSGEIAEREQFTSDLFTALKKELEKYMVE